VLESAEAVEDKGFRGRLLGSSLFVEEQTVAPETFRNPLDRAVGDIELASDLTESRDGRRVREAGRDGASRSSRRSVN
jgi:hypothetical protein